MKTQKISLLSVYSIALVLIATGVLAAGPTNAVSADIIIYGATPGGIIAAVQAKRLGKTVILVDPDNHIGGATTGGLGWTDYGKTDVIGGLAAEFYGTVTDHYRTTSSWRVEDPHKKRLLNPKSRFIKSFEPHVALNTFKNMLADAKIKVVEGERLNRSVRPETSGTAIRSITMESGKTFSGKMFIDASYEGDLMAQAGISYHVGRESRDTYKETAAGVLPDTTATQPSFPEYPTPKMSQPKRYFNKLNAYVPGSKERGWAYVDPFNADDTPLFGIQDLPLLPPGTGDKKIQAYCVRICLTADPKNRIEIERPDDYDGSRYELLARYIKAHHLDQVKQILYKIDPVPNLKTDINDGCPFSTDYIGANWDYPEADYKRRKEILDDHHSYTRGLLYFLGNDPRVPAVVRKKVKEYGYPKDEFVDNGHWTPQVYIRETRRMMGTYVMTQRDIVNETTKSKSIALGSYALDSHHVQRVITPQNNVINEGNFTIHLKKPYEIPYGAIIPKENECTNLVVPVCMSSSHVAYGSIRMEPIFMQLGQAAATAAVLAINANKPVQDISYESLKRQMLKDKMIIHAPKK